MYKDESDAELVKLWKTNSDQNAIRELVKRHHNPIYKRFVAKTGNATTAHDLTQETWLRVTRNICNYEEMGIFANFLSTVASSVLVDYYRRHGRDNDLFADIDDVDAVFDVQSDGMRSDADQPDHDYQYEQIKEVVAYQLVPKLPVKQRIVWLLVHESEQWDEGSRLDWGHLAALNGIDVQTAWSHFASARSKVLSAAAGKTVETVEDIEMLIFLIWTQVNRASKNDNYTLQDFAELLDIPLGTVKTQYRQAKTGLEKGLTDYLNRNSQ